MKTKKASSGQEGVTSKQQTNSTRYAQIKSSTLTTRHPNQVREPNQINECPNPKWQEVINDSECGDECIV